MAIASSLISVARDVPDVRSDPAPAGASITAFGVSLFTALCRGGTGNVVVSPVSVAMALAMLEPGAVDAAGRELRAALRAGEASAFHASMNALGCALESRDTSGAGAVTDRGEVRVHVANAAYLDQGLPFRSTYLDAVGRSYGPVLHAADFTADPDAVAHEINDFVAGVTAGRIPRLVADGVLDRSTALALVNALHLKASWRQQFERAATASGPFHRLDGTTVDVALMHGNGDSTARGAGWVGATKHYVGGLAAQFVLPDPGRFDEVVADLEAVLRACDASHAPGGALVVPRLDLRHSTELSNALWSLGVRGVYERGGLLGIAGDERLVVGKAITETFVVIDEEGTEAAAATMVSAVLTSAALDPPPAVVLDRPFVLRVVDDRSGATLMLGRIVEPAGGE